MIQTSKNMDGVLVAIAAASIFCSVVLVGILFYLGAIYDRLGSTNAHIRGGQNR